MSKIDKLLVEFPPYSEELGIDLTTPAGRFRWFLASILFGARISEKIALNTYQEFERAGVDAPGKILSAGWDELVRILDEGGYVRYDESTATNLLSIMADMKKRDMDRWRIFPQLLAQTRGFGGQVIASSCGRHFYQPWYQSSDRLASHHLAASFVETRPPDDPPFENVQPATSAVYLSASGSPSIPLLLHLCFLQNLSSPSDR